MTGLPNRFQLNEKLEEAVARAKRSTRAVAVMYLDIDHFKQINDSYGHAVGDAVLVEFAQRLLQCVRVTDTVARLAGDEFIIVLEQLHSADEPRQVANKIIDAMMLPWWINGQALQPTTSIGIAYAQKSDMAAEDLLNLADRSLYEAKRAGRNTFRLALD